jgi:hypothetical protein
LPDFIVWVEKHLDYAGHMALVDFVARNPLAGAVVPGTGGVRKLRWGLRGRGKRGGARIIYYFLNESVPLVLISGYAKNEKATLTADDKALMKRLVERTKELARSRR